MRMESFQAVTQPVNTWDVTEFFLKEFYTRLSVLGLTRILQSHSASETAYQVGGNIALYLALASICSCVRSHSSKETVQKISPGEGVSLAIHSFQDSFSMEASSTIFSLVFALEYPPLLHSFLKLFLVLSSHWCPTRD